MRYLHHVLAATALVAAPFLAVPAQAQVTSKVVSSCGSASFAAGTGQYPTMDTKGNACSNTATVSSAAVPSTNASTTVTAGGTYQTVFASSTTRKGCAIQNPTTATENLSVRIGGAAVFTLGVGTPFNCASPGGLVISDLIEVTATTTGHAFTAVSQ